MNIDELEEVIEQTKMKTSRVDGRGWKEGVFAKRNMAPYHNFRTRIRIAQQTSERARKKKSQAHV